MIAFFQGLFLGVWTRSAIGLCVNIFVERKLFGDIEFGNGIFRSLNFAKPHKILIYFQYSHIGMIILTNVDFFKKFCTNSTYFLN